jgi:predicted HTH domain antitoxin
MSLDRIYQIDSLEIFSNEWNELKEELSNAEIDIYNFTDEDLGILHYMDKKEETELSMYIDFKW